MNIKRKTSNEKAAQIFHVISAAMIRLEKKMESVSLEDLLPEHKKDVLSFIKENKQWLTMQGNSAERTAGHYSDNLKEVKK